MADFTSRSLAQHLNQVVADAERAHERSREARKRDFDRGRSLCNRWVDGVWGRAHAWCVVFKAPAACLVESELAHPDWFKSWPLCKELVFDGRTIELFRVAVGADYELTICYKASDCADDHSTYVREAPPSVGEVLPPKVGTTAGKTYRFEFDRCGRPRLKPTRRGSGKGARSKLQAEVDELYSDKSADA